MLSVFQITQHPGFPFSKTVQDRVWVPSSLLFNKYRGSFTRVKQPGREVEQSLPTISEGKNVPLVPLHTFNARPGTTVPFTAQELKGIGKERVRFQSMYYQGIYCVTDGNHIRPVRAVKDPSMIRTVHLPNT